MTATASTTTFTVTDEQGLADFWRVCSRRIPDLVPAWSRLMSERPELMSFIRGVEETGRAPSAGEVSSLVERGVAGDWGPYASVLARLGGGLSRAGVGLSAWWEVTGALAQGLVPPLIEEYRADPSRLSRAIQAMQYLSTRSMAIIGEGYLETSRQPPHAQQESFDRPGMAQRPVDRLLESGIMGILLCDLVGNIKDANDSFLATFGYTREDLRSGAIRWAEMTPPEFRHLDDRAVEQLKARGVTQPWEKEYFHKDGSRVPILVGVAMLNDAECIAFVLDISERRRLEELRTKSAELEAQNHRIQESSRLKSEFLANMSHELRTPLNSIIGFTDLLHKGEVSPDSPQHKDFLGEILSSGRHLLQLINDVLDLAKVESGKLTFHPETVDLSRVITDAVMILRSIAASKHIEIKIDVDPALHQVTLDPSRLKQVLFNYGSNALKFTNEGGTVSLRAFPEGSGMFRLEVEDTGIGIAAVDIGRLFLEFEQLDAGTAKRHAGTGLGLALTKRIVEAQGGSVGVRSVVGVGSVFFVTLPLVVRPLASEDEGSDVPPPDGRPTRILVVEDNPRDRALLLRTLHGAGYGVELASTGAEAVASCADHTFSAITLDLLLPDMTGLDVLHRVRTEGKNTDTPVIVVTVVADKGIVGGFSVYDFLNKPVNGTELVSSLKRAGILAEKGRSILVVDDDPSARKLMETKLVHLGYRVDCCSDGRQGLALVAAQRPSAVVLDLLMPDIDGFEFLVRLRQDPANLRLPVIVWTMKDLSVHDHERLRRFAQAVVAKGERASMSLVDELGMLLARQTTDEAAP